MSPIRRRFLALGLAISIIGVCLLGCAIPNAIPNRNFDIVGLGRPIGWTGLAISAAAIVGLRFSVRGLLAATAMLAILLGIIVNLE